MKAKKHIDSSFRTKNKRAKAAAATGQATKRISISDDNSAVVIATIQPGGVILLEPSLFSQLVPARSSALTPPVREIAELYATGKYDIQIIADSTCVSVDDVVQALCKAQATVLC